MPFFAFVADAERMLASLTRHVFNIIHEDMSIECGAYKMLSTLLLVRRGVV